MNEKFYLEFASFILETKKPVKKIVQRKDWQALRKSLVGKWKQNPAACVSKLRGWLGSLNSASDDKLRIVMNYLTGSGFRSGKIKHPSISNLRDQISNEMKRRKK